ncbi:MAG TPA: hypothetical protein PLT55_04530 [Acidimicrobiia bacterium]|nr:hypothetical protein [Acidimicrobiia bacterium]
MNNLRTIGVIDIGTNTTRLLVRSENEPKIDLSRKVEITRLGADLESTGSLGRKGIEDTSRAAKDFVQEAQDLGSQLEDIYIFATAASRNAQNGDEFIENLRKELGCSTEIISGEQEGNFAFAGAISGLSNVDVPCVVFDIGGGSTEFAVSSNSNFSKCAKVVSVPIGSVRITKRHLKSDPPLPEELTNTIFDVKEYLNDVEMQIPDIRSNKKWIGVAATVTTAAAIELGLAEFNAGKIHEMTLTREMIEEIFRTLATENLGDRKCNPGLEPERADVIVGGIAIIVSIMRHFDLPSIQVSCTDLLDGLWMHAAKGLG